MEIELYEMKKMAKYALGHKLTPLEIYQLNGQLKELEGEVYVLEKQLHSVVH